MSSPVVVVGAGMGGLAAAIRLARRGVPVVVFEARDRAGGLAAGVDFDTPSGPYADDGGPYILLDRPGLAWALEALDLDLASLLDLLPLDEIYRVRGDGRPTFHLYGDLERTVEGLESSWPGAGQAYAAWIRKMVPIYENLRPLQHEARPSPWTLARRGLFREGLFLLRGLEHHLRAARLPSDVVDGIAIWTQIAGQALSVAPAPMAFVPPLVHTHGAYVVRGGMRRLPEALERVARSLGVAFRFGSPVTRVVRDGRTLLGVEVGGELVAARAVVSDVGVATYLKLLDPPDPSLSRDLGALPLQSPGVCAWLRIEGDAPFLCFDLPREGAVRALVHPGAVDDTRRGQARLVSPVDHGWAERVGVEGQRHALDAALAEARWREGLTRVEVVASRIPAEWGQTYHLWRDSMNPVMSAAFMRRGRLPHTSPVVDGLYLCGAATHPGQWVSFCAISGILAADAATGGTR